MCVYAGLERYVSAWGGVRQKAGERGSRVVVVVVVVEVVIEER